MKNKGFTKRLIEYSEKFFQQWFKGSEDSDDNVSFTSVFFQLNYICNDLNIGHNYSIYFAFDIIYVVLRSIIKLLDIDKFIYEIDQDKSMKTTDFLRQFFRIVNRYNIHELGEKITGKIRREIIFSLFDEINSSKRIISYLENNLSTTNPIIFNTCGFILYTLLKLTLDLKIKFTGNELEKYQNNLINSFILFINEYFIQKENLRANEKQNELVIRQILVFICSISDKTSTIPILINANCSQACLRWLTLSYLDDYEYKGIIYILNNIARHDEGAIILRKFDCAKIVRQFKTEGLNRKLEFMIDKELHLKIWRILDLILALIVDPDELYVEEINSGTINHVLSISKMTSKCVDFTYGGYHISEPLIALMKLCTNDNIIHYILHQDQCLIFFCTTLKAFLNDMENQTIENSCLDLDILAIMALANILWSISFHDQYKNDLIQNIYLIKQLEEFRENDIVSLVLPYIFIPYQMSSLRRVIGGIWQNLYPSLPSIPEIPSKSTRSIMISYSHVNTDFCRELFEMLNRFSGLTINVDIHNGKYLWKEIIQIIEQSDAVIFLLSNDFYYSKSCRQEFIYITDTLQKLFFPVFIDHDFKPTGWLQKRIARLKYIRFGEKDFKDSCEEILSLINENLSMNLSLMNNPFEAIKWNDKEIKQWFINHNIIPDLYEFYHFQNGNELLLYADATLAFPWIKEYERIKLRFEGQEKNLSQDQFLVFINALKRL